MNSGYRIQACGASTSYFRGRNIGELIQTPISVGGDNVKASPRPQPGYLLEYSSVMAAGYQSL
jgi:hypothetical protein